MSVRYDQYASLGSSLLSSLNPSISMNCLLYARVSTDKQADKELSIPAQLLAMRDYARQRDWVIVEEFVEPGASAKTAERPVLQRLLTKVTEPQTEIGVVLVHKIDRLARNVHDHATIKMLLHKKGVRLSSVVENVDDTVSGQLVENIMASIAQFYSANLSDEVKKGMRQKVLGGGWPHLPPRGYISVRHAKDAAAHVEVHPGEGPTIRRAFELYATGLYSLKRLAAWMAGEGVTSRKGLALAAGYLQSLLANPFYAGRVRWKDLDVTGAHEPLVSSELFAKVRTVMTNRFHQPRAKGSVGGFVLRGIAICGMCRGHMTGGIHKRKAYYNCSRRSYNKSLCEAVSYCRADVAHDGIADVCGKLRLSKTIADKLLKSAERAIRDRRSDAETKVSSLLAQRASLVEREARLTQAFISGQIVTEAYKATAERLKIRVATTEAQIRRLQQNPAEVLKHVEALIKRAESISELGDQISESRKVQLLHMVFDTIVLDANGVIGFALNPPFDTLFKSGSGVTIATSGSAAGQVESLTNHLIDHAERHLREQIVSPARSVLPADSGKGACEFEMADG
jgi:site-specific DNA recombinase